MRIRHQEGVPFEILVSPPVPVPASRNQHGFVFLVMELHEAVELFAEKAGRRCDRPLPKSWMTGFRGLHHRHTQRTNGNVDGRVVR